MKRGLCTGLGDTGVRGRQGSYCTSRVHGCPVRTSLLFAPGAGWAEGEVSEAGLSRSRSEPYLIKILIFCHHKLFH